MTRAYVALGANLGDPQTQVRAAMDALDVVPNTRVVARSSLYLTPPWGVTEQPAFVNAVVALETACSPHELLAVCRHWRRRPGACGMASAGGRACWIWIC